MTIRLHKQDLPADWAAADIIAIDTETLGLNPNRDRLCLMQLSRGDGTADLVQIAPGQREAKNLARILNDKSIVKLFHFARFDMAVLFHTFGAMPAPAYCTKIASKLTRTYTDKHGLKDLLRELLGVEISKQQQSSDWGADKLSEAQLTYAASDVLYLHQLKAKFDELLIREERMQFAKDAFAFLPARAKLDLMGWEGDLFAHS
jgi:ribonuclease D